MWQLLKPLTCSCPRYSLCMSGMGVESADALWGMSDRKISNGSQYEFQVVTSEWWVALSYKCARHQKLLWSRIRLWQWWLWNKSYLKLSWKLSLIHWLQNTYHRTFKFRLILTCEFISNLSFKNGSDIIANCKFILIMCSQ